MNTPIFMNFMGTLDVYGAAAAQFNLPPMPAGYVGTRVYFAYCLNNLYDFVSNPMVIEIVP